MSNIVPAHSPLRIFAFSIAASVGILLAVLFGMGAGAFLLTLILAAVEITFSFENAVINAKVLARISRPWQVLFLTVGIVVAIFGMRILFPIIIVSLTAHLSWQNVIDLALHHPEQYAHHLEQAHTSISAFGGAFLLMLALTFFFDDTRAVRWIQVIERPLHRFSHWSAAPLVAVAVLVGFSLLPANGHGPQTFTAGLLGVITYVLIQSLSGLFSKLQGQAVRGAPADGTGGVIQPGVPRGTGCIVQFRRCHRGIRYYY
ncbi:MAG: DUF475 domain-containing protein [Candidatus Saccharibacteria bacterium]